jgi:hypothetical protein
MFCALDNPETCQMILILSASQSWKPHLEVITPEWPHPENKSEANCVKLCDLAENGVLNYRKIV